MQRASRAGLFWAGATGATPDPFSPNAVLAVVEMGGSEDCLTTSDEFAIMTLRPPETVGFLTWISTSPAKIASSQFDIPVIGQFATPQLLLGSALELGRLKVIHFNAFSGVAGPPKRWRNTR
jgi:hypothetical protein